MEPESVRGRAEEEIARGERARAEGNEGRARACARRAAGWAVEDHLARSGSLVRKRDAVDLLRRFRDRGEEPGDLREAAGRLTARVTPEHRLPHPEDPLEDARRIVRALLPAEAG
ncbi:MAG: hypothetical protein HY509_03290 [Acidobacteria bacterium]|nr:hypothetical protein [Acidobacteriota bacterium]